MPRSTRVVNWRYRRSRRARRGGRIIWRVLLVLVLLTLVGTASLFFGSGVAAAAVYSYFTADLPDFTELELLGQDAATTFETTKIYAWGEDSDGDGQRNLVLIYEVIDPLGGDRQWIPLEQMPQSLIDATVAIEDRTFWTNQGFDLQGIGRAFYEYVVLGGSVQGGSSITQQVVKNNLIDPERRVVGAEVGFDDYRRKVEELLLAQRISQVYTKEQILEWYLNTNFYGNLAYGIEAAARVYFDKPAAELTLAEASMLAAIPQSPALNPIDNPDEAKFRQELVLDAMLREGLISQDAAGDGKVHADCRRRPGSKSASTLSRPILPCTSASSWKQRFGPEQLLRGGLRVYTSLDLTLQRQAECVARAQVNRLSGAIGADLPADELAGCAALAYLPPLRAADVGVDHEVNNAAVVAIDPPTGRNPGDGRQSQLLGSDD